MKLKLLNAELIKCLFFFISLFVITLFYWPGLSGNFMLDDLGSLPPLYSSMDICGFWCGVMSGSTGPTGRPVSLLTFALQFGSWPNPFNFKLFNLGMHLFNAVLVFFILSLVLKRFFIVLPVFYIALLATLLWALWPLQVSSVLYVIQRMALLSSFFVLLGILFYLIVRIKLEGEWFGQLSKWLLLCFGLSITGLLAIYSKESGVLLLVYVFVLEAILFRRPLPEQEASLLGIPIANSDKFKNIFWYAGLVLPMVLFVSFILVRYIGQADYYYGIREFNVSERFLTQGLVLIDYLKSLFLPKASNLGLYHDSYPISISLFSPITTLFSWIFIVVLLVAAWFFRKKNSLFSLAVFWFFGGHILESTILPLEIYFEHRNYLPIVFLTFGLVYCVYLLLCKASRSIVRYSLIIISVCYLALVLFLTFSQAKLWGDPISYGVVQAHEHPESVRARSLLVDIYNKTGYVDKGYEEMLKMQSDFPDVAGIIVGDIEFACYDEKYKLKPLDQVIPKLETAKFGYGAIVSISQSFQEIVEGKCKSISVEYLYSLLQALKKNTSYTSKIHLLENNEVNILTFLGRYDEAVDLYSNMTLEAEQWPRYISLLGELGRFEEALAVSQQALKALAGKPHYSMYYQDAVRFHKALKEDIQVKK